MRVRSKRLSKLYEKLFPNCAQRPMTEHEFLYITLVTLTELEFPERISVELRELGSGRGYYFEKHIMLPTWIGKYHPAFQVYYLIHEICHCIVGHYHTPLFKITEDHVLAVWSMRIVRRRVYPKKLYFNGEEILNVPTSMKGEEEN